MKELLRMMLQLQNELRIEGNVSKKWIKPGDGEQDSDEVDDANPLQEAGEDYNEHRQKTKGSKVVQLHK